jgi:hypothetical protein
MDVAHTRHKRPAPFAGLLFQYLHNVRGHPAFLMGQRSESGWWYYFPCAFFLKSTPSELFLVAAGRVLVARLPRLPIDSDGRSQHAYRAWVATISVFSVLPLFARLNIGHRYLLILYPVLFLTVTDLLWAVAAQRWRLIVAIAVGLLAVQGCSSIAVAPEYLSYFSPLVGGASQGHEFLVDSNLDWGQDLPQLRDTLRRLKYRHVLLKYFGTALPQAYGLDVDVLESNPALPLVDYDGFAVSVTHLHGLYLSGDLFAGFRHLKPVARAGHTIVVYDLHDPAASACLKAALESMASDAPDGS